MLAVRLRWLASLFAALCWASASAAEPGDLSGWRLDAPQAHGVSASALDALRERLERSEPSVRALLLLRHGQPVFEYYRQGLDAQTLHPVHSVTKSVVSTLVGVAIAQGRLDSAERTLPSLLDEARAAGTAPEVARIRLADLLTQRSGFERIGDRHGWFEAYAARYPASPVMAVALQRPVQAAPGTRFLYSNLDTHLVSVALGRQLGMPLADFARDALFAPLGIQAWSWPWCRRLPTEEAGPIRPAGSGGGAYLTRRFSCSASNCSVRLASCGTHSAAGSSRAPEDSFSIAAQSSAIWCSWPAALSIRPFMACATGSVPCVTP